MKYFYTMVQNVILLQDLAFTDDKCLYLMFPVKGGQYDAVSKKTRKHATIPAISSRRVCIKSCGIGKLFGIESFDANFQNIDTFLIYFSEYEADIVTTEATILGLASYTLKVKIINLAENFNAPKPGTKEYEDLSTQISNSFAGVLNNKPGYHKISVMNLEKYVFFNFCKNNL